MENTWLYVGIALFVAWLIYRLQQQDKDVMYYQYIGGVTFIIRRKKVNIFVTRYRIYSAYTFKNPGEAATKERFYFLFQAQKWILDRRGKSSVRSFRDLGSYKLGVSRDGQIMTIQGDQWQGETILARNVEKGARVEQTAQVLFRYWLGPKAIQSGKLA